MFVTPAKKFIPIKLVFHQHLNLHIAYPGSPPEPSNHMVSMLGDASTM